MTSSYLEYSAWDFAALTDGGFSLHFERDQAGPSHDTLPWTIEFSRNGEALAFAGHDLETLLGWAIDFANGKRDENGRKIKGA